MFDKVLSFLSFGKENPPPPVEDNEPVVGGPLTGSRGTRPTPWLLSLLPKHKSYGLERWWVSPQPIVLPPDFLEPEPGGEYELELVADWVKDFRRRVWEQ